MENRAQETLSRCRVQAQRLELVSSVLGRSRTVPFRTVCVDLLARLADVVDAGNIALWLDESGHDTAVAGAAPSFRGCLSRRERDIDQAAREVAGFLETAGGDERLTFCDLGNHARGYDVLEGGRMRSFCLLPMETGGTGYGWVGFFHDGENVWDPDDLAFQRTVAVLFASALEHDSRARSERKLSDALAMVDQSAMFASLGAIAGGMIHEINQPLTAIRVNADGVIYWDKKNKGVIPQHFIDKMRDISQGSQRISEIIEHVRKFLVTADEMEKVEIDLNEIVVNAQSLVDRQVHSHGIELVVELWREPLLVRGIAIHLEQIVVNLIVNALQMQDRIKKMYKRIAVLTRREDIWAVLQVTDNGPGLPATVVDELFARRYPARTASHESIGLMIVNRFVEEHGGEIGAVTNDEAGMTFTIRLPLKE